VVSTKEPDIDVGRRDALKAVAAGTMAVGAGLFSSTAAVSAAASPRAEATKSATGPYNFLFVLTDQERYFRQSELPTNYLLRGRQLFQHHEHPGDLRDRSTAFRLCHQCRLKQRVGLCRRCHERRPTAVPGSPYAAGTQP
jgi:hypothetical protein